MIPGVRNALFQRGEARGLAFCRANKLTMPEIHRSPKSEWRFGGTCAYYRPTYIAICIEACATPGYGGRQWSWPGYVVDRTPFGVLQHELGHHADIVLSGLKTGYQGEYSRELRAQTREDPITTYCPNDAEWFAEIFRLFVTNADLLRLIRPRTYDKLRDRFEPVSAKRWRTELGDAPERTILAAERKIEAVGG